MSVDLRDRPSSLWPQVDQAHVIEQRRATLRGRGVIVLQENRQALAAGMDGDLPDVLMELETGKRMAEMLVAGHLLLALGPFGAGGVVASDVGQA